MKRISAMLLILAVLLLAGCGAEPAELTEGEPAPPTAAEEAGEGIPEESPEEPALDPIAVDPGLFSPAAWYALRETEDYTLEATFFRSANPYSGSFYILYRAKNLSGEDIEIDIADVKLNGSIQTGESFSFRLSPGEEKQDYYHSKTQMGCALIGLENIREYSASVALYKGDKIVGEQETCTISFPEGIHVSGCYRSSYGMRADRQVLRSDDKVTVALLWCGQDYLNLDHELEGVLWIENHGEEPIPVSLSMVELNGVSIQPTLAKTIRSLPAGKNSFLSFTIMSSALEESNIQSVHSMRLQILTSQEENSGNAFYAEGGAWYPVALAESGPEDPDAEQNVDHGRLVYDDGLLQLSLSGVKIQSAKEAGYSQEGCLYATYTVYVVNRRAEGVSFQLFEPMIDGEPYWNEYSQSDYITKRNYKFGPQSEGYMLLTLGYPENKGAEAAPELSFRLQVRSQGGHSILYTTPDRIVLSEKEDPA